MKIEKGIFIYTDRKVKKNERDVFFVYKYEEGQKKIFLIALWELYSILNKNIEELKSKLKNEHLNSEISLLIKEVKIEEKDGQYFIFDRLIKNKISEKETLEIMGKVIQENVNDLITKRESINNQIKALRKENLLKNLEKLKKLT